MTADKFRSIALALPGTIEAEHMNHPDFRVRGKIFATLGMPDRDWGMVKLSPKGQAAFCRAEANVYRPVPGAWGRKGCTYVRLRTARVSSLRKAMFEAWSIEAPESLADAVDER